MKTEGLISIVFPELSPELNCVPGTEFAMPLSTMGQADMRMTKDEIYDQINKIRSELDSENIDDEKLQLLVKSISKIFPNSRFSNLIFYPEIDRDTKSIMEEIEIREKLFRLGGRTKVDFRVLEQCRAVLNDSGAPPSYRYTGNCILDKGSAEVH